MQDKDVRMKSKKNIKIKYEITLLNQPDCWEWGGGGGGRDFFLEGGGPQFK